MSLIKLNQKGFSFHFIPALIVLGIAIFGTYRLVASHADNLNIDASIKTPGAVQLIHASPTAAALTWTPSTSKVSGYVILRDGVRVGTTDSFTTNFVDTATTAHTTYAYSVESLKGKKVSPPATAINVTTDTTATPITGCGTFSTSASYVLNADLPFVAGGKGEPSTCLIFSNINNFSLDCQGHTLTMTGSGLSDIDLETADHFLITNCIIDSPNNTALYIHQGTYGSIVNNTLGSTTSSNTYGSSNSITNSSNLFVYQNNFNSSLLNQDGTNNGYIGHNTFTWPLTQSAPASITSSDGSNNVIYQNTINGGAPHNGLQKGLDDGIVLGRIVTPPTYSTELNDVVDSNTMSNTWDMGIEGVGTISGTIINNNSINDAAIVGIGSYHYTSWLNNSITNNVVSLSSDSTSISPTLFIFKNIETFPTGVKVYFENNKFTTNTLVPSPGSVGNAMAITFDPAVYVLGKNTFKNNNMGHAASMYAPYVRPTSLLVDGGGNICPTRTFPTEDGPLGLVCN